MSEPIVAARRFTASDQDAFARISGDFNPMHMDAVAARRTQAGDRVVHGVHGLLWALDAMAKSGIAIADLIKLDVQFLKFIYLDERAELALDPRPDGSMRARVVVNEVVVVNMALRFGSPAELNVPPDWLDLPPRAATGRMPIELTTPQMFDFAGWLEASEHAGEFGPRFPALTEALGLNRVAGLALLSTLVGMICPGLHSIFAALTVEIVTGSPPRPGIGFKVDQLHDELRAVRMQILGNGLRGSVRAFVRWPPVEAPSIAELSRHITPAEFAGTRAFIAGGSRGLGAVTAKLIAAGGGEVVATYMTGRSDAEQLAREINEFGRGTCEVMPFDAGGNIAEQLAPVTTSFNQLYYFATPQIFKHKAEIFSAGLFEKFLQFYVYGFFDTCRVLSAHSKMSGFSALYPSSISVETRPDGMTEYSMAKAAGEMLCADLASRDAQLRIIVSRLPRTLTDQTASIARAHNADPTDVMLPLIHELCGS